MLETFAALNGASVSPRAAAPAEDDLSSPVSRRPWVSVGVVAALLAATFAVSLQKVWDPDIFWHLACGNWMLDHGRVLDRNLFGIPDPGNPTDHWVNVHWLYQLLMAGANRAGGFELLSLLSAVMSVAAVATILLAARRQAGPMALGLGGMLALSVISLRLRLRPSC